MATGVRAAGCGAAAKGALAIENARQAMIVDGIDAMVASPSCASLRGRLKHTPGRDLLSGEM
jgi:hypothetical protein